MQGVKSCQRPGGKLVADCERQPCAGLAGLLICQRLNRIGDVTKYLIVLFEIGFNIDIITGSTDIPGGRDETLRVLCGPDGR